jgi:hypothetical protein
MMMDTAATDSWLAEFFTYPLMVTFWAIAENDDKHTANNTVSDWIRFLMMAIFVRQAFQDGCLNNYLIIKVGNIHILL